MALIKKGGLVHRVGHCVNCGMEWNGYLTVLNNAREHAERTGHTVSIESGFAHTYKPTVAPKGE